MEISLNGHTFTSLGEIIKSVKRSDNGYVGFTVEPTDLFREVWENPHCQRGPLDKFHLERATGLTFFVVAGSDWSSPGHTFWHTKPIVQVHENELIQLGVDDG